MYIHRISQTSILVGCMWNSVTQCHNKPGFGMWNILTESTNCLLVSIGAWETMYYACQRHPQAVGLPWVLSPPIKSNYNDFKFLIQFVTSYPWDGGLWHKPVLVGEWVGERAGGGQALTQGQVGWIMICNTI